VTRIMKCARSCTHPAQDRLHGAGLRLHNLVAEEGGLALHRLSRLDPWKGEQAMTRTDRQDRERARVLLLGSGRPAEHGPDEAGPLRHGASPRTTARAAHHIFGAPGARSVRWG